ncbi:MAG: histidine kinase [Pseudomonadota bacterium]
MPARAPAWSDPISRLRHLLQTLAFCLAISAIEAFLEPETPYLVQLVYAVAVGTACWAFYGIGCRLLVGPDSETGWPGGGRGLALVLVVLPLGYGAGTTVGDAWFGWSSWQGRGQHEMVKSILVTAVAGAVITYFFYSRGKSAGLTRRAERAQREAAEARLKLLEVQLEPHMLFNTLANLRALIATDPPRAETMLDHLIAYLRATLGGSRVVWHPLGDEFARLDDYLALMAVRMGARLRYTLDLPRELRGVPVPPLLLQPLVENAIRHGLEPQVAGGHIQVTARVEEGPSTAPPTVVLTVCDTGAGLPPGDPAPGSAPEGTPGASGGFGTRQVQERLRTAYGAAASLGFAPVAPTGTQVTLRFPLPPPPTMP